MFHLGLLLLIAASAVAAPSRGETCDTEGQNFLIPSSCSEYYTCADGRFLKKYCPTKMFFSPEEQECTFASEAGCKFDGTKAKLALNGVQPKVYMTFDDGPGHGTKEVLDVLKKNGVKATFFVLGAQMDPSLGEDYSKNNAKLLKRMLDEGHQIGDHSFDHMSSNGDGSTNAYKDVEKDLGNFGKANSNAVRGALRNLGLTRDVLRPIRNKMESMVRMPFTNNWRVKLSDGNEVIHDCIECTVPTHTSGANGVAIAERLYEEGKSVYGWDVEWATGSPGRLASTLNPDTMLATLSDGSKAMNPGKVVVLVHDTVFGPDPNNPSGISESAKFLDEFLQEAKVAGYQFRTLDTYPSDAKPNY